jgi:hypothetical protein
MEKFLQNRYIGDVGDYAKYGLLRMMARDQSLRLGVVWCLFDDESHNDDGRHIGYLKNPIMRDLDPELHDHLSRIVTSGRRSVKTIARTKILSKDTVFFNHPISTPVNVKAGRLERSVHRGIWLSKALHSTSDCDLIFFDPDNGLETKSVPPHSPKSGKYIFWNELLPFWERGQSLLIYHHLNRTAPIERQYEILKEKFSLRFEAADIRCFLFRRGSCRHFWLIANKQHSSKLELSTQALLQSPWREYFDVD